MADAGCFRCWVGVLGLGYIIGLSLFFASFEGLPPNKMGIVKDTLTNRLTEDRVYLSGLYFLGLTKRFETYPYRAIPMYIKSIQATSKDRNNVELDVSCQYRLNPNELFELYRRFGRSYHGYYESQIREIVQQEANKWETEPDFFVEREAISRGMAASAARMFNTSQATLVGFQLRSMDLPDSLEQAKINTLIARQLTTTTEVTREATVRRTEAANIGAEADAEIQRIQATFEAQGTRTRATATASQTKMVQQARADALLKTTRALDLTQSELLELEWQKAVPSTKGRSEVTIGFDDASFMDNALTSNLASH